MKTISIFLSAWVLSFAACKSADMKSSTGYKTGKDRDDGTGDKNSVDQNSAFGDATTKDGDDGADGLGNSDQSNGSLDSGDSGDGSGNLGEEVNEDQGDPQALASVVDVVRFCSNKNTERAGTNLKASQSGVVVSLIPADGRNKKAIHFHDQATATRIRSEVMNYGRFQLPLGRVPGGAYEVHLCGAQFADSCKNATPLASEPAPDQPTTGKFKVVRPAFTPLGARPGLIGTALIDVKKGRLENIKGALLLQRPAMEVLTDVNKQDTAMKMQMFNMFGAAISQQSGVPYNQVQADLSGVEDCDSSVSPLIVDLGHKGIDLSPPFPGTSFDMDADGQVDQISWPRSAQTMFLALDLNGNGKIDDGSELFGNNSPGPDDGAKSANGFLALAKYDDNKDGVINAKDAVYERLRLWSDANFDAKTQDGELLTLPSQGVVEIDLEYVEGQEKDVFGNSTRQRSVVKLKGGLLRMIVDLWFRKT